MIRPALAAILISLAALLSPRACEPAKHSLRFVGQPFPEGRLSTISSWSPVGHRLVLDAMDGLVIVDPDSIVRPLRLAIGRTTAVTWRQDGALLACRVHSADPHGGLASIVVVSLDTGEEAMILERAEVGPMAFDAVGRLHVWPRRWARKDTVLVVPIGPPIASTAGRAISMLLPLSGPGGERGFRYYDGDGRADEPAILPRSSQLLDSAADSAWFLVWAEVGQAEHTLIVDRFGRTIRDLGPRNREGFSGSSMSPDGRRILGFIECPDDQDVCARPLAIHDVTTGRTTLVRDADAAENPMWSRDGRFVAYDAPRVGTMIGTIEAR